MVCIKVMVAKHFYLIEENAISWVDLRKDLPFIHVHGAVGGWFNTRIIERGGKGQFFRCTMDIPRMVYVFYMFPICDNHLIIFANVIR